MQGLSIASLKKHPAVSEKSLKKYYLTLISNLQLEYVNRFKCTAFGPKWKIHTLT